MARDPAALALLAMLALSGCAGSGASSSPDGSAAAPGPAAGTTTGPAATEAGAAGAKAPPAPPPGFDAPASLAEGDRWFVSVRPGAGREPFAERHRRRRDGDVLREEVTWGRSFAEVASAVHGLAQVFAVLLDAQGLKIAALDETGRIVGEPPIEVAAPFRAGTSWNADLGGGVLVQGRIEALEDVDTPAGKVPAIRVRVTSTNRPGQVSTIWYDAGLRPVRGEVRPSGAAEAIEARAALASAEPTPEECRAALEWAKANLGK
jgi:hypothetical protein